MKYYWMKSDLSLERSYEIDGAHKWMLPGIRCLECKNVTSDVATAYPSVDLTSFSEAFLLNYPSKAITRDEYAGLVHRIERFLSPQIDICPGAKLGSFSGNAAGDLFEFTWLFNWTIFLTEETAAKLMWEGLNIWTVPARIKWDRKKPAPKLEELEIGYGGEVSEDTFGPERFSKCQACGWFSYKMPREIRILQQSIKADLDLFRPKNLPSAVVASERFMEAVSKLKLRNVLFNPIQLV